MECPTVSTGRFETDETPMTPADAGRHSFSQEPLWPSLVRRIELPCARTGFVETGCGFPLVLVHGLMGYSFSWRKNIPALEKHFRVLALDLAGCGGSGPLKAGTYSVETWSHQLEEFMDALGVSKAYVVATSAGGAVALDLASRCPERVERMALVAPVTRFCRRADFMAGMLTATGLPAPLLKRLIEMAPVLLPWLFRHRYYFNPGRITPETIPGYLEGLRGGATVPMLQEAISEWNSNRGRSQLSRIQTPLLLLWGEEDKIVPPSCIPSLLEAFRNAALVTIPHAGHLVFEEFSSAFNDAIRKFFQNAPDLR